MAVEIITQCESSEIITDRAYETEALSILDMAVICPKPLSERMSNTIGKP